MVSYVPATILMESAISENTEARLDGVAAVSEMPNASSIFYGIWYGVIVPDTPFALMASAMS